MPVPQKIVDALTARETQIVAEYGQAFFDLAVTGLLSKKVLEKLIAEFPDAD